MRPIFQQLVVLTLFSLLAGCAGAPARSDLPAGPAPHTVYVVQYGWHTALLFDGPAILARSARLRADFHDHRYMLLGWGDGAYFVAENPPWSTAVKALVASDYPALQAGGRDTNPPLGAQARDTVALAITEHGYQQLAEYIDRSIAADADGKPIYLGKQEGSPDRFYQATGNYSVFNNCNSWVAGALQAAGVPVSGFNLTARSVFEQAEKISKLQQAPAI
ncbi:conserved hypothetical protein [Duganella sp. CF402]|uniref:DUF2459 domain-containing protein n=1 Tax=unclassified Duganella TaxID=2636909 RepID=UPI0008AB24A8|nr:MULTISPECIES: DUF2459 domain-containing protein [unclassified Duganella]RZT10650.1 uncharacterized protein (TIGR02117 family) [Duganella sp. BK701]SEL04035.1 conserved hypothetical protein [Duganella sp. CF402]